MQVTQLTGQVQTHLTSLDDSKALIHKGALSPFLALQSAAKKSGFNLQIASGFRSFERQQLIWNRKYSGVTTLLDKNEQKIDLTRLTELEKLTAILHWSALPGASRHHWGTDFDIYDPDLLPQGQSLQLTNSEYINSGYFSELNEWLTETMPLFNFYRPYQTYQGGVATEPWHISYFPIADDCLLNLNRTIIHDLIMENNVLGKSLICEHLPMIYKRFINNINLYRE